MALLSANLSKNDRKPCASLLSYWLDSLLNFHVWPSSCLDKRCQAKILIGDWGMNGVVWLMEESVLCMGKSRAFCCMGWTSSGMPLQGLA